MCVCGCVCVCVCMRWLGVCEGGVRKETACVCKGGWCVECVWGGCGASEIICVGKMYFCFTFLKCYFQIQKNCSISNMFFVCELLLSPTLFSIIYIWKFNILSTSSHYLYLKGTVSQYFLLFVVFVAYNILSGPHMNRLNRLCQLSLFLRRFSITTFEICVLCNFRIQLYVTFLLLVCIYFLSKIIYLVSANLTKHFFREYFRENKSFR